MTTAQPLSRRTFLAHLGRGTIALAVVSIAGCTPAATASPAPRSLDPSAEGPTGGVAWERVDLGFVSAYVLVRAGEAAIVDTGTAGNEGAIEAALTEVGLGWDAVGHVILTHLHSDHAGSAAAVLEAAAGATGYAGAEDLTGVTAPRPLVAVADGDRVFDLLMIATPGHTPGHIAVLDDVGGILVAGDALGTSGGAATGPNSQFTADMGAATASVAKLGALVFETLLVGHGDPVVAGASAQVAALAGS